MRDSRSSSANTMAFFSHCAKIDKPDTYDNLWHTQESRRLFLFQNLIPEFERSNDTYIQRFSYYLQLVGSVQHTLRLTGDRIRAIEFSGLGLCVVANVGRKEEFESTIQTIEVYFESRDI